MKRRHGVHTCFSDVGFVHVHPLAHEACSLLLRVHPPRNPRTPLDTYAPMPYCKRRLRAHTSVLCDPVTPRDYRTGESLAQPESRSTHTQSCVLLLLHCVPTPAREVPRKNEVRTMRPGLLVCNAPHLKVIVYLSPLQEDAPLQH